MACSLKEEKYGYEDCRFEKDVDEHFHCSICYNVLKDARMCRNNEHVFCLACISEHLKVNSQTCPECSEHLSVDTLRRPRVLNNYLSKLKINCNYASRGCPEYICVEELEAHVAECGFAPMLCSNESCGMEINRQEREHHETVVCEFRKVKCHDCGQIQEVVGRIEGKVEAANKEIKDNHADMKKIVGKLEGNLGRINKKINEKVQEEKEMNEMVNEKVEAITNRQNEIKQEQQQVKKEVGEVKREIKDVKENLSEVNKDVDEVKVMMRQMLEKFNMLELMNKMPSPTEEMLHTPREDILIAGGSYAQNTSLKSSEIFSWEKNAWFEASPMIDEHSSASSLISNDQLFVVGGKHNKTIETLDLSKSPLKWTKFRGELPFACDDHQTVVCQQRVFYIGGYNYDKSGQSDVISELQLTTRCTLKELCQMPEPRECHGAEVFEDKILILGGQKSDFHALDNVVEFDPLKNECEEMPPLPYSLRRMATVRWRDQAVLLGGRGKNNRVLNDVFMYDCKTGKTTALPAMMEKRRDCCAVIKESTIVVMGGMNENDERLNSVECFTMGHSTWKYLPAMNEARCGAVAEVLPST